MSDITSRKYSVSDLDALTIEEFSRLIGNIFEHSPWIAEAAAVRRPFATHTELLAAMTSVVSSASPAQQLALLKAHPDLAGRLAAKDSLSAESQREQAAAGLTQSDAEIRQRMETLNAAYKARFGFPFIICARLNNTDTILAAMEFRLNQTREVELATALEEILKIAQLRLVDIVDL